MKEIHHILYQYADICPTKTVIYKKIADENMLYALAYFGRSKIRNSRVGQTFNIYVATEYITLFGISIPIQILTATFRNLGEYDGKKLFEHRYYGVLFSKGYLTGKDLDNIKKIKHLWDEEAIEIHVEVGLEINPFATYSDEDLEIIRNWNSEV